MVELRGIEPLIPWMPFRMQSLPWKYKLLNLVIFFNWSLQLTRTSSSYFPLFFHYFLLILATHFSIQISLGVWILIFLIHLLWDQGWIAFGGKNRGRIISSNDFRNHSIEFTNGTITNSYFVSFSLTEQNPS